MKSDQTMEARSSFASRIGPNAPVFLVILATALALGLGLKGSFHFDDFSLFSDPAITSSSGWWQVWQPLRTRPLTYLTFWVNYQLGGTNPVGYLAVNLAIHLYAVWLFYGILRGLIGQAAVIAVILFALHPIQAEPVLYVFERATLLGAAFCLLCWRSWLDRKFWVATGWFGLALLSKEECVSFPLFLCLFERAVVPVAAMCALSLGAGIRVIVAMAALHLKVVGSAAATARAAAANSSGAASPYLSTLAGVIAGYFRSSLLPYLCTQGIVILHYFRLILLPYGFTVDPDFPAVTAWQGSLAWVAILFTAALLWKRNSNGRWFAAGLLLLLPSSSVFPAADLAADRRLYLPMLAFAPFAGLVLKNVNRRLVVIPLALGLAFVSYTRTQVWRSEQTLWSEAVARSPEKLRPLLQLSRASEPEAAMHILDRAEALAPNDFRPCLEKGLRFLALNRPDQALPQLERAMLLAPNDTEVLNNHGVALTFLGQQEKAADDFRRALSLNPCMAIARRNLQRLGLDYPVACQE